MSVFSGQYGSFGGGYMTGHDGKSDTPSMQFGGGFLQAPQPLPGGVTTKVAEVVYALDDYPWRPKDRSGRRPPYEGNGGGWPFEFPVSTTYRAHGVHRQKRYR